MSQTGWCAATKIQIMKSESLFVFEKSQYPSGAFSEMGENLRVLTRDESSFVPPVRPSLTLQKECPIIVATSRDILKNRRNIENIMTIADGLVIFFCSGNAKKEDVATIAQAHPGLEWFAMDGPYNYDVYGKDFETPYSPIAFGKTNDLAEKRNIGLLLGRAMGWEGVFLLDDDLAITKQHLLKAKSLLFYSNASAVGFSARSFPDHSVVVHARRLVSDPIDSFIGSGAMAIRTNKSLISFYPHIYNEDWLFMLMYGLIGDDVVWAGTIEQEVYNPFKNIQRANNEEPGDILGESLTLLTMALRKESKKYANFEEITNKILKIANESFWEKEINKRISFIRQTREGIYRRGILTPYRRQALKALDSSLERLIGTSAQGGVRAEELTEWVRQWIRDLKKWNAMKPPARQCTSLAEAIEALGMKNEFVGSYKATADRTSESHLEKFVEDSREVSLKDTDINEAKVFVPHPRKILQNLSHTYVVQQYLEANNLGIDSIMTSAAKLRFDRPTVSLRSDKPHVAVCMMVMPGESIEQITLSFRDTLRAAPVSTAIQFIVWVYGSGRFSQNELEVYRNQVIASLVRESFGTNTFLRSSIIIGQDTNIDHIINTSLGELAFAYWSCGVAGDHSVFVVNSRNELLRWGTFWEFMRGEHKVPGKSLQAHLHSLPPPAWRTGAISQKEDEIAQAHVRLRLAGLPVVPLLPSTTRARQRAVAMGKRMHRAKLSWSEIDSLAYNFQFHHEDDEDSVIAVKKNVCIPVVYSDDLPSDKHERAREIIAIMQNQGVGLRSCSVVVYGAEGCTWKDLERYRRALAKIIKAQEPTQNIVFTSLIYRRSGGEDTALFRKRVTATILYMHWLQNYTQKVATKWLLLDKK